MSARADAPDMDDGLQRQVPHGDDPSDTPTVSLNPAAQATGASAEPLPGSILASRYLLEEVIGRGGTSVIYRARDTQSVSAAEAGGALVAIKLLRTGNELDSRALMQLEREYRRLKDLSHSGIARVFERHCDGGIAFVSMEHIAGQTVKDWLRSAERDPEDALKVICACCDALESAHSAGIVHGDLKPTNVMVTNNGDIKLVDFGCARDVLDSAAPAADMTTYVTSLYASPQVLSGQRPDARDDVFSLACLSYYILSGGRHPFGGRPSLENGRIKSAPTYVRTIPVELFEVIERGLSEQRERRHAAAGGFLRSFKDAERRRCGTVARGVGVRSGRGPDPAARVETGGRRIRIVGRDAQAWAGFGCLTLAILAGFVLRPAARSETSGADHLAAGVTRPADAAVAANDHAEVQAGSASRESGVVSFVAPTILTSPAQPVVAILVRRTGARGRGFFAYRIERAASGASGNQQPTVTPHLVRFAEGQAVRTLFIPLSSTHSGQTPSHRSFNVVLQETSGGLALGRLARVTVAFDARPDVHPLQYYQARAER